MFSILSQTIGVLVPQYYLTYQRYKIVIRQQMILFL